VAAEQEAERKRREQQDEELKKWFFGFPIPISRTTTNFESCGTHALWVEGGTCTKDKFGFVGTSEMRDRLPTRE